MSSSPSSRAQSVAIALLVMLAFTESASSAPLRIGAASIILVSREMGREIGHVEQARPALESCAAAALAEDPRVAGASVTYRVRIGPAGDVVRAEIAPVPGLSASGRACLGRALERLEFDLPDGGGRDVEGAIVFGLGARGDGEPVPFPSFALTPFTSQLWPLILDARPRPPEERALTRILGVTEACSAVEHEQALRVRGVVAASGALFDVDVAPAGSTLARCVRGAIAGARPADAGTAIAIDVGLTAELGKVRLAR